MQLVQASTGHLLEMMDWFHDRQSCVAWGGPEFRFPYNEDTFRADARFGELASYLLLGKAGELQGLGQYTLRAGRCHLARLAVSPAHRDRGLGTVLIRALRARACNELGDRDCSLFVMADNAPAMRLYERLGFSVQPYPEPEAGLEGCVYMVAAAVAVEKSMAAVK